MVWYGGCNTSLHYCFCVVILVCTTLNGYCFQYFCDITETGGVSMPFVVLLFVLFVSMLVGVYYDIVAKLPLIIDYVVRKNLYNILYWIGLFVVVPAWIYIFRPEIASFLNRFKRKRKER